MAQKECLAGDMWWLWNWTVIIHVMSVRRIFAVAAPSTLGKWPGRDRWTGDVWVAFELDLKVVSIQLDGSRCECWDA